MDEKEWYETLPIGKISLGIVSLICLLFLNPCVIIDPGHKGVVITMGAVSDRVLDEGVNFKIPIIQTVKEMDVRILKNETSASAASKDLQNVTTVIAVNYRLTPDKVNHLYKTIGTGYETIIIEPAIQEVVKAVTAQYSAAELITLRETVSLSIKKALDERLTKYDLVISDFSIKDFKFSDTFTHAIEAKQEADQNAQKAERDLQRIKIEAEQQIATARAEAEALRLKNVSVSPLMIQLHAIEKWDGKLPVNMFGNSVPFINIK